MPATLATRWRSTRSPVNAVLGRARRSRSRRLSGSMPPDASLWVLGVTFLVVSFLLSPILMSASFFFPTLTRFDLINAHCYGLGFGEDGDAGDHGTVNRQAT